MSDVIGLLDGPSNFPLLSDLLTATHHSLALAPHPVCSIPWQVPNGSGISIILVPPMKSRLHLHSLIPWSLSRYTDPYPATHLASAAFLNCGGRFHNSFRPVSLALKPKPLWSKLPNSACLGWNPAPKGITFT